MWAAVVVRKGWQRGDLRQRLLAQNKIAEDLGHRVGRAMGWLFESGSMGFAGGLDCGGRLLVADTQDREVAAENYLYLAERKAAVEAIRPCCCCLPPTVVEL